MKTHIENPFSFRADNPKALFQPQECVSMHTIFEPQTAVLLQFVIQELELLFCFTFLTRLYFEALRQEVMWRQHCIHEDSKIWRSSCVTQVATHALCTAESFMNTTSSLTLKMFLWLCISMCGYIHTYKCFLVQTHIFCRQQDE